MQESLNVDIQRAVEILQRGGVIVFPTETTYGLGCDPRDARAVRRIFEIKDRDSHKPLLLVAGSWDQVEQVVSVSPAIKRFAQSYWPGPLTLVLPAKSGVALPEGVVLEGEVSIRFSSSDIVRQLTDAFGFPLIATSANRSGQPDSRSVQEVEAAGLEVDAVIDGGVLPSRKPSTLARIHPSGVIEVLRQGEIELPPHV